MNPKISVIVPVYNVEKYLEQCVDSILNQTFKDIEIILVDDGSTDRSGYICDEYIKKDNRIQVIHQKNGGLSYARNVGIDKSMGEFIAFIDSDDYIHPQMIEILYDSIIVNNSDLSLCNFKRVYEGESSSYKNECKKYIKNNKCINYSNIEALRELQGNNGIAYVIACNKLYNKNIFENLRYKVGQIHEDEFIIHEILYRCKKISYVEDELYYYLQRNNSITGSTFNIRRLDGLDAYIERILFYKKIKENDLKWKAELTYIREFLAFYNILKIEIENSEYYQKKIYSRFRKRLIGFIINQYLTNREKIGLLLFCINPNIYSKYKQLKTGRL